MCFRGVSGIHSALTDINDRLNDCTAVTVDCSSLLLNLINFIERLRENGPLGTERWKAPHSASTGSAVSALHPFVVIPRLLLSLFVSLWSFSVLLVTCGCFIFVSFVYICDHFMHLCVVVSVFGSLTKLWLLKKKYYQLLYNLVLTSLSDPCACAWNTHVVINT